VKTVTYNYSRGTLKLMAHSMLYKWQMELSGNTCPLNITNMAAVKAINLTEVNIINHPDTKEVKGNGNLL